MKRPARVITQAPGAGSPIQPSLLVWADDGGMICGVDEAGRGPLAGPVTAAAVILNPMHPIDGLRDPKQLSAARRDTPPGQNSARPPGRGWARARGLARKPAPPMQYLDRSRAQHMFAAPAGSCG